MNNQIPIKSNWEVEVTWLAKMQDLYFSTLLEII